MKIKLTLRYQEQNKFKTMIYGGEEAACLTLNDAITYILAQADGLGLNENNIEQAIEKNLIRVLDKSAYIGASAAPSKLSNFDDGQVLTLAGRDAPYILMEVTANPNETTLLGEASINNIWKPRAKAWKDQRLAAKKIAADQNYNDAWRFAFSFEGPRKMAWLNPANGVALAAVLGIIGGLITHFASAKVVAMAAPIIVGSGVAVLALAALALIPFSIWECYKHFKNWQAEEQHRRENDGFGGNPPKPNYVDYLKTLSEQFFLDWPASNPVQFFIVIFAICCTAALIGGCVGFFFGNETATYLFGHLINVLDQLFSQGISAIAQVLGIDLSLLLDPQVISIISAACVSLLPLIAGDLLKRVVAQDSEARQAGGELVFCGEGEGYKPFEAHPNLVTWHEFKGLFCCSKVASLEAKAENDVQQKQVSGPPFAQG